MNLYLNADAIVHPDDLGDGETIAWVDMLRWLLSVMDEGDTSFSFIAGCLAYVTKPSGDGHLTQRQASGVQKIFERVRADYINGQLDCQNLDEVA